MKRLIENITGIYGEAGRRWLNDLPNIVNALALHWRLSNIMPVDNMTYNYVARAIADNLQPVMLKISCDAKTSQDEICALRYFNGEGSIKLLGEQEEYHAMLLQQAIPGTTLKSLYPDQLDYVMDQYITVMKKLHGRQLPSQNSFAHVRDWLQALQRVDLRQLPAGMAEQARKTADRLLATMRAEKLLHGDLHHDNFIKHQDEWLTIDPKGIVGDAEFEIAAFDIIHSSEFHFGNKIMDLFAQRINLLARKSSLDVERIKDWVFVRLVLSVAWSIEDNTDIGPCIELATALLPLLNK